LTDSNLIAAPLAAKNQTVVTVIERYPRGLLIAAVDIFRGLQGNNNLFSFGIERRLSPFFGIKDVSKLFV
jgi:hypothetical protein